MDGWKDFATWGWYSGQRGHRCRICVVYFRSLSDVRPGLVWRTCAAPGYRPPPPLLESAQYARNNRPREQLWLFPLQEQATWGSTRESCALWPKRLQRWQMGRNPSAKTLGGCVTANGLLTPAVFLGNAITHYVRTSQRSLKDFLKTSPEVLVCSEALNNHWTSKVLDFIVVLC